MVNLVLMFLGVVDLIDVVWSMWTKSCTQHATVAAGKGVKSCSVIFPGETRRGKAEQRCDLWVWRCVNLLNYVAEADKNDANIKYSSETPFCPKDLITILNFMNISLLQSDRETSVWTVLGVRALQSVDLQSLSSSVAFRILDRCSGSVMFSSLRWDSFNPEKSSMVWKPCMDSKELSSWNKKTKTKHWDWETRQCSRLYHLFAAVWHEGSSEVLFLPSGQCCQAPPPRSWVWICHVYSCCFHASSGSGGFHQAGGWRRWT